MKKLAKKTKASAVRNEKTIPMNANLTESKYSSDKRDEFHKNFGKIVGKLKYLVIHCTATPDGRNVSSGQIAMMHKGPLVTNSGVYYLGQKYNSIKELPDDIINGFPVKNIRGRGWSRLGYSEMIHIGGELEELTPSDDDEFVESEEMTWGVKGINQNAHHIVYVGGVDKFMNPKDTRTNEQHDTLAQFVKEFILKHPNIIIVGHNQFANKACPSFNVNHWLQTIGVNSNNMKLS